jgi:membrane protein DedA with SNARE-associated domain
VEEREARRIPLPWLLTPFLVMTALSYIGLGFGPKLITEHPLLQMFLNPSNRYFLLASPQVAAVPFFAVGFVRLLLTDPIAYVLGRQYGEAAVSWAEKTVGDEAGLIRKVEQWFGKAAPVAILIAPNFYLCVLAGSARMRPRVFVTLNVIGTIGRLLLIRLAGRVFEDELETVLRWIQRYQWWLIGVSLVVVAVQIIRAGGKKVLESPTEMAAEIEAEEAGLAADDGPSGNG